MDVKGGREIRLSRFMAMAGISSRRGADEMISSGFVTVNGKKAVLGQKVRPGIDVVAVKGRAVGAPEAKAYIALNKPPGYLSSRKDPFGRPTVMTLLDGVKERVYPAGRLDLDSEGLVLLTNDGRLAYLLMHPKHEVVKEYVVKVVSRTRGSAISDASAASLFSGIILGGKTVEVDYAFLLRRWVDHGEDTAVFRLGVHEGEKHLVKKLCFEAGFLVKRLIRTKIGSLTLSGIASGKWRRLTENEVRNLYEAAREGGEGEGHVAKS